MYEYKIINKNYPIEINEINSLCKELGWRLVAVTNFPRPYVVESGYIYYFERPLEKKND